MKREKALFGPGGNGDLFYKDFRMFSRSAFFEELESQGKYLRKVNPWEKY